MTLAGQALLQARHEHGRADAGLAVLVADVRLVLVAEVADVGQHRVGRRLAEAAERRLLDRLAEVDEALDVALLALAVADARDDLEHALGADAAGRALAAALLLDEVEEEARHVDHAGVLVHDDEAAGAHDGAELGQRLEVDRRVEVLLGDAAARRAAELRGLELLAVGDAAADVVDDVAERDAEVDLDEADVVDRAGEGEDLGAGALLGAGARGTSRRRCRISCGTVASVSTLLSTLGLPQRPLWAGKGGRGRGSPRLPSIEVMSAVSSPQTKAPEPLAIVQVEAEVGVEDVLAEQAVGAAVGDRRLEALERQRVLGAAVDVALVGADRVGADQHALDDRVRVALEHRAVHERAGVALVGVAEDVLLVAVGLGAELPLEAGGEAGAAAAAQAGAS